MQDELDAEHPELAIDLLIVDEIGFEDGLDDLFAVTDLPVLQDTEEAQVWVAWAATWRDTWVLDGENVPVGVVNLTDHNLGDPEDYAALYDLLVSAAGG